MGRYNFVKNRIETVASEGYGLHLESLLSKAFSIYKRSFFLLSLVLIMYTVALTTIWFSTFEYTYGVGFVDLIEMAQQDPNSVNDVMGSITLMNGLIYSLAFSLVAGLVSPIFAGIYRISYQIKREQPYSVLDLFVYYKQPYFVNLFIYSFLLAFVVQYIGIIMTSAFPLCAGVGSIWLQIFLNVSLIFTAPLIVFGDMKWLEAVKASFRISFKNWFFLMFVLGIGLIISYLGVLLCGVGIIFTYSFLYVLIFVIYDDVIGFEEEKDVISEIGEN